MKSIHGMLKGAFYMIIKSSVWLPHLQVIQGDDIPDSRVTT